MQDARESTRQILESFLNAFRHIGRRDGTGMRELGISVQDLRGQYAEFFVGLNNGPVILLLPQVFTA
jgi:hypothetical protein